MIRKTLFVALMALAMPAIASAQDPRDLSIRTFRLKNMKAEDAAKLLGPYVMSPGGGVFDAGGGSITVRETSTVIALVDSLLRVHDRARAVISMRFKLIAALDSSMRDPAIETIDAELRKLFRFPGYQLIGEGTMLTEEMSDFMTSLATKPVGEGKERFSESFQIRGWLDAVAGSGTERAVRANIILAGSGKDNELLRTGISVPIGQTVILGSARPTMTLGTRQALILVVQPEIVR